jgi:hypothetical protein
MPVLQRRAGRTVAPPGEAGVRFVLLNVVVVVVLFGCAAADLARPLTVAATGLVTALLCLRAPVRTAAAGGVVAWAWLTGFAVHADGYLSLSLADLARLGVLVGLAVGAALVGRYGVPMTAADHETYLATRTDDDGAKWGVAVCERCGPLCLEMHLDGAEQVLRRVMAEHWVAGLPNNYR